MKLVLFNHDPNQNERVPHMLVGHPPVPLERYRVTDIKPPVRVLAEEDEVAPFGLALRLPDPPCVQGIGNAVFRGIDAKG
ncbi:hypothetical protein D3C87_1793450 [compost metagenome]